MIRLIKEQIEKIVSGALGTSALDFKMPGERDDWDLAVLTFRLAKELKLPPQEAGKRVFELLEAKKEELILVKEIKNVGPFVNIVFDKKELKKLLWERFKEGFYYPYENAEKTVVVEYSSPNIAKPIHVHHIRSTVIGHVIANIYERLGYRVIRINYLGDWGTQFGKLLAAYRLWGEKVESVDDLFNLYIRFHREEENSPELKERASEAFKALENGDEEALALWKRFRAMSIEAFKRVYDELGIKFDVITGEGEYFKKAKEVAEDLLRKGVAVISEGAVVIETEGDDPPIILLKQDGTTIYASRDLAAAIDRINTYEPFRMFYVVATDQTLHFRQLNYALRKIREKDALPLNSDAEITHVDFGLLFMEEGKMSTRKGRVISLSDVIERGAELALKEIEAKNPGLSNKEYVAKEVAKSAIFFSTLFKRRKFNITFKWEEMLNFSGESGPYLQYSHARACSLLRKFESEEGGSLKELLFDETLSLSEHESPLISELFGLFSSLERSAEEGKERLPEPFVVVEKALKIAQEFNRFYYNQPILKSGETRSLLKTVILFKNAMAYLLDTLGITPLEEM